MLGLMIRDLMVQRKRLWIGVAYCVAGPLVFRSIGPSAMVAVVVAVEYMILLTAFAYDDKYKVDATLASLPIGRKPLVIVRYLEAPVLAVAAILCYMLVTSVGRPVMEGMFPTGWLIPATALLGASLMSSIYMPIIYRFGYVKARIFNIAILMVFGFLPSFALSALASEGEGIHIPPWLASASEGIWALLIVAAAAVVLTISCLISIRVYRKRPL